MQMTKIRLANQAALDDDNGRDDHPLTLKNRQAALNTGASNTSTAESSSTNNQFSRSWH